ncbi:MAG TPA: hypothetical protein VM120_03265 [Bryobacteraceae bacterium]|nr:hypothetical protein [Bryobacteraceae bacterium]
MTESWGWMEGVRLAAGPELRQFLGQDEHRLYFSTDQKGPAGQPTIIATVAGQTSDADEQLRRWTTATGVHHPHLVQLFETGWTEADGVPIVYSRFESADEDLASICDERCLTTDEAREVLAALIGTLSYLHQRQLVHGAVEPRNIVAIGPSIKLAVHDLQPFTEAAGQMDIRAAGLTLYQLLTQHRDPSLAELDQIPEPFRAIIRGTVKEEWPLAKVAATLDQHGKGVPLSEVPQAVVAGPIRRPLPNWVYGFGIAGSVLLLVAVILLARKPARLVQQTNPPVNAPPAVTAGAAPVVKPSPFEKPKLPSRAVVQTADQPVWRLIAYTYNRKEDAEARAKKIQEKNPQFRAEVFAPQGATPPYLITLGGKMTRPQAIQLQRQARSKGLPRDMWIRNYR